MGGFTNAISNALAARGNALAQGELQRGQVWGNLAANLGQIPFQAMQAHQRRNLAEVETQQRGLQNQAMQKELDFQKEAYATMSRKDLTPEQLDLEMGNLLKRFGKFEQFEALQSRRVQTAVNKYNILKGGPGAPPEGGFALPEPTRGVTTPGGGVANAFAPVVPAEQQMVNPEVNIPGIGSFRPQTHGQQQLEEQQKTQAAAEIMLKRQQELQRSGIEGQKEVAAFQEGLKTDKPPTSGDTDVRMEGGKPITYQYNVKSGRFDIRVGEARPTPTAASLQIYRNEDIPSWADALARGEVAMTEIPAPIRGKVMAMARAKGNAIVPKKVREQITALNSAKNLVTPLRTMLQDIVSAKDPAERTRASLILKNYGESISGRIARSFGEVGTMNEGDIKRATGLVPGIIAANFDPDFATRELDWLDTILKNQEDNFKRQSFATVPINPSDGAAGGGGAQKVGDIKTFPNGNKGRWDGKGWEKVQ